MYNNWKSQVVKKGKGLSREFFRNIWFFRVCVPTYPAVSHIFGLVSCESSEGLIVKLVWQELEHVLGGNLDHSPFLIRMLQSVS